jgi:hypothetical protein
MAFFSFLILAWIVLLAILLWDLIQKGQNKLYMFILIPASLLLTITTYITIQGLLGYPTEKIKEGKFILISSAVKEPDWVYYWVVHEGDQDPIAYKVPYTKGEHKKQEEVDEAMQQGSVMAGEFEEGSGEEESTTNLGHLEFYKFDFSKKYKKSK